MGHHGRTAWVGTAINSTNLWFWKYLTWYPHCLLIPYRFRIFNYRKGPYFYGKWENISLSFQRHEFQAEKLCGYGRGIIHLYSAAVSLPYRSCKVKKSLQGLQESFYIFPESDLLMAQLILEIDNQHILCYRTHVAGAQRRALSPALLNLPDVAFEIFPLNRLPHSTAALKEDV